MRGRVSVLKSGMEAIAEAGAVVRSVACLCAANQ